MVNVAESVLARAARTLAHAYGRYKVVHGVLWGTHIGFLQHVNPNVKVDNSQIRCTHHLGSLKDVDTIESSDADQVDPYRHR